jgi:hypothetical protein
MWIASSKYLEGLRDGDVPVVMLFSGSVFYAGEDAPQALQVAPVPWTSEARFSLPLRTWREAIDQHYAGHAPLSIRKDVLERLLRYRSQAGLPSCDAAIESLLPPEEGAAR